MFSSRSHTKMSCGLKVDTNDPGWQKSMTKVLRKIKGVSYTIDAENGMAYVTGVVDPMKLLKKLQSERFIEICWVNSGSHNIQGNVNGGYFEGIRDPNTFSYKPQMSAGYWPNQYDPHYHHHYHPIDPSQHPHRPYTVGYPHYDYNGYPSHG